MSATLLNTTEAGKILGIHPDSVSRLARLGEIEYELSPRGYRFRLSVIKRYKKYVRGPGNPDGWEKINDQLLDAKWADG